MLKLSPAVIGFLQLLIGAIAGVGGLVAYSEAKFASQDKLEIVNTKVDFEINQRRTDIERIEKTLGVIAIQNEQIWKYMTRGDSRGRGRTRAPSEE